MKKLAILVVCALVFCAPVAFADISPAKPSDTVVLIFGAPARGACPFGGELVNARLMPDGTLTPFTLPVGQVLMVTGIDYATGASAGGVPTNERIGFVLRSTASGIVLAEGYTVNTGLSGAVTGATNLSTPMRMSTGVCVDRLAGWVIGGTRTWVRGYLIQDK